MQICVLSSGSKGNCVYINSGNTSILIDNGISFKQLKLRAESVGINLSKLSAMLITHEHSDHIKGVGVLSRNFDLPVYSPHACYESFIGQIGDINYMGENKNYELGFKIGELDILPFRTPHDSVYSVGYRITGEEGAVAIATDLGKMTDGVFNHLKGADIVVLESNHDINMLKQGAYPPALKRRILSNNGHLSNDDASDNICKLCGLGTKKFVLAHLSEDNNTPQIAFSKTMKALNDMGAKLGVDVDLKVARQYIAGSIIDTQDR